MLGGLAKRRTCLVIALALAVCGQMPPPAAANQRAPAPTIDLNTAWTGDFDAMLQRRLVRVLVPYSKTLYFLDRGRQLGVAADFGQQLETWLNQRHRTRHAPVHVMFVPVARDQLIPSLRKGLGDVIIANLTVTDARDREVDFTVPWLTDVSEVVVTGPAAPPLANLDALSGKTIPVRVSSSYHTHLLQLNERFLSRGLPAATLQPISENLEDEDLLDMVNAGLLPFVVVDDFKARAWATTFPRTVVRSDLVVNRDGRIAWAVRPGSPMLMAELDAFLSEHRAGTVFGNAVRRRYFGGTHALRAALADEDVRRFNGLWSSFAAHGKAAGFDPVMLAAQGYQESQLVQSRRSPRGAVGVMQLLPRTAAAPPINIRDIASDADLNIKAGALYMRHLATMYVNDPALMPRDRLLMSLAAYNAGPGNLRKFRRKARAMGLNPDIWFDNVEQAAARIIGRETVRYVGNIYKYYVAYGLLLERDAAHDRDLNQR